MTKSYYILVSLLVITVLVIGAIAFYKTTYKPPSPVQIAPKSEEAPRSKTIPPAQSQNTLPLAIDFPKDGVEVNSSPITVSGTTVANADLTINDKDILAGTNGKFKATLGLEGGDNPIIITAADDLGNSATWEGTVTYTAP